MSEVICQRCPCVVYDPVVNLLCAHCLSSSSTTRLESSPCTRCGKQICIAHSDERTATTLVCRTCQIQQWGQRLDAEFVLGMGVYIPSYIRDAPPTRSRSTTVWKWPEPETNLQVIPRTRSVLEATCAICLTRFDEESGDVTKLGCQHMFHVCCLTSWFERSRTCPTCRNTHSQ